jgi:hypothetical protein
MTDDPWDDERLDAAYVSRGAAHATPADLTDSTLDAIRSGARPATVNRWPRILAAAAVVVIVIGGVAIVGLGSHGPNPGAATPSGGSAEATTGSLTPSGSLAGSDPTEVDGLTVISVSDASAVRDSGVDGRELAVRGWYVTLGLACPSEAPSSPLLPTCADMLGWLMQSEDDLKTAGALQPTGPAIHADLIDVAGFSAPSPADVVMVGHFDDRRAGECPADVVDVCRDQFVVDRIWWVDGTELEPSDLNELGDARMSTTHDVTGLVAQLAPGSSILSSQTVSGERLAKIEPGFRTRDEYGLTGDAGVWIVRTVANGEPATYLVVDGASETYRITADGGVVSLGRATGPHETWPPAGSAIVNVPGVEVAVVDLSNHVLGARPGARDPTSLGGDLATKPISLFTTATAGELLLTWSDSGCDRRAFVTVGKALTAISVERIEAPNCQGDARNHGLILTFDDPVDVESVELSVLTQTTNID